MAMMDNLEKVILEMSKKTYKSTSEDGLVTLEYMGTGEYTNLIINDDLNNVQKDKLEKDIISLLEYAKNQISVEMTQILMNKSSQNEEDGSDNEDRRDVS